MKSALIVFAAALAVWAWCGAIMGIGLAVSSEAFALTAHAILAPIGGAVAAVAVQRLGTGWAPAAVAAAFVGAALALDAGLVAPVFMGSYRMFEGVWGVWLPLTFVFFAAWGAGHITRRRGI